MTLCVALHICYIYCEEDLHTFRFKTTNGAIILQISLNRGLKLCLVCSQNRETDGVVLMMLLSGYAYIYHFELESAKTRLSVLARELQLYTSTDESVLKLTSCVFCCPQLTGAKRSSRSVISTPTRSL